MSLLEDLKALVDKADNQRAENHPLMPDNALAWTGDAILLSALRGPDERGALHIPLATLKKLVTARIRWIVFQENNYPGDTENRPMGEADVDDVKRQCRILITISDESAAKGGIPGTSSHFLSHLCHAIEHTKCNPIWGGVDQAREIERVINTTRRYD